MADYQAIRQGLAELLELGPSATWQNIGDRAYGLMRCHEKLHRENEVLSKALERRTHDVPAAEPVGPGEVTMADNARKLPTHVLDQMHADTWARIDAMRGQHPRDETDYVRACETYAVLGAELRRRRGPKA